MAQRQRIVLNESLGPVLVEGSVMHELCNHAIEAAPEECCGLITGTAVERFRTVRRVTNVMNRMHLQNPVVFPRDAHHAYYMGELEYLAAQKAAEESGEQVTAVYHSHVEAGAYLSHEDIAYAEAPLFPFPGAAQIVISVLGGRVSHVGIFEIRADGAGFAEDGGRRLEVAPS